MLKVQISWNELSCTTESYWQCEFILQRVFEITEVFNGALQHIETAACIVPHNEQYSWINATSCCLCVNLPSYQLSELFKRDNVSPLLTQVSLCSTCTDKSLNSLPTKNFRQRLSMNRHLLSARGKVLILFPVTVNTQFFQNKL